jgi:hypothetical protein
MAGETRATLGGGARPAVVALPCFSGKGGRSGRVGRVGQKVEQADGAAGPSWARNWRKIPFRINIWFLNLPRLWKFVQGDLGGILTQGFFLNSYRILKDFRKIQYDMPWMLP